MRNEITHFADDFDEVGTPHPICGQKRHKNIYTTKHIIFVSCKKCKLNLKKRMDNDNAVFYAA